MDSGLADEYWLTEFVGEEENWVSKYLQDIISIVDEESDSIGERSTPVENATNAEVSSIPTSISSSTTAQQRLSAQKDPERIPFSQKWEILKPEIERLYITENVPLRDIVRIMKEKYDFDAIESQYKYHFKKWWGSRKNIRSSDKRALIRIAQERAKIGKVMVATYKGRPVETRKLQREAKKMAKGLLLAAITEEIESHPKFSLLPSFFASTNGIFLKWNIPQGFLHLQKFDPASSPSPLGVQISVPKDFHIHTPPEIVGSQYEASSPVQLSAALASIGVMERASMFLQGRHNELIKSMNRVQASTMSIWLYQFWLFGFTSAKNWGRGPRTWNATNLGFLDWRSSIDSATKWPDSPESGAQGQTTKFPESHDAGSTDDAGPCQFCRWSLHPEYYLSTYTHANESDNASESSSESEFDGEHWPESWKAPPFDERPKENLESNDFSSINMSHMPVSVTAIVKAAKSSPNGLLEEAIGFSIMGRNASLLCDLLLRAGEANLELSKLNPFHLAISYLDGSKTCCLILGVLHSYAPVEWRRGISQRNSNDLGHTLLDTLMITILRNHTSVSPATVDNALKKSHIFPGQETDICGRWDADSQCYHELLLSGKPAIPSKWKHKFCHTSAQAVCHCIAEMNNWSISLEAPSGLFLSYCSYCGAKLQLSSLHALIMTSFYLATAGYENEDLFGSISCLLNLLTCGIDPQRTSTISLPTLLGAQEGDSCSHEDFTLAEFAEGLVRESADAWPEITKTGWQILCHILRVVEEIHDGFPLDSNSQSECGDSTESESDEIEDGTTAPGFRLSCSHHEGRGPEGNIIFGKDRTLGHLWAAAQAELLTHRRQCDEDPWTSEKFDLPGVLKCLRERETPSIPLVRGLMMRPYCMCGFFKDCFSTKPPTQTSACLSYISNMNHDWRETLIDDALRGWE